MASKKPVRSEPGLALDNCDKFYKDCAKTIGAALGVAHVRIHKRPSGTREFCQFASSETITGEVEGANYQFFPISPAIPNYWVAIEASVEGCAGVQYFQHLSLKVVQGEATIPTKQMIFRAEWDARRNDDDHAQPHWHVYDWQAPETNLERLESFSEIDYEDERLLDILTAPDSGHSTLSAALESDTVKEQECSIIEAASPAEPTLQLINTNPVTMHFHFAMSAIWHQQPQIHKNTLGDEKSLVHWLNSCLKYVQGQFYYLDRKSLLVVGPS